jgi:hypothetical protein
MKLAPKSWKRPVVLLIIGAVLILGWLKLTWWRFPNHVYDEAGLLDRDARFTATAHLAMLTKTTGVDVRVIITSELGGQPIEVYAIRRMRELKVGTSTERRGLLVVLDPTGKQARIEVGPKLEGIVTDAYAGYVARDVLAPLFVAGTRPSRILAILFHTLKFRIDEGVLGREWDPAEVSAIRERQRLAVGGGADAFGTPADLARMASQPAPPHLLLHYTPQPTAALALERYLEWVQEPYSYDDVGLLTEGTREIQTELAWDISAGAWRFDQVALQRERFLIVERGWRAVAIPTVSPLSHPAWFVRGRNGWRFELLPEYTIVRNVLGEPWNWMILTEPDGWVKTFGDLLEPMSGGWMYRFRDGNNTPIPGRGSYR